MKQSHLFTKTRKEAPKDEVSKNAQLLIRAGYIYKEMAGVYAFLPLGLRVMNRICTVIREEMNAIGGQEVLLTSLQKKETWEKTGRFSDEVIDIWFKTKLKNDTDLGLAPTHEEPLTVLMREYVHSYKDLPCYPYQIQTKFRNETRAKSGIMRGREFLMKDLYSFSKTQEEHDAFYEKAKEAYTKVFNRLGIGEWTFVTFASGGSFSKFSHEFQTLSDAGEDVIYVDREKNIAINKEVMTGEVLADLGVVRDDLVEEKAIEVGNIFSLGTRFSESLDLTFTDQDGENKEVIMGSYGIGPGRLMGTVAEVLSDEKGLIWPGSIAPFDVHIIALGESPEVQEQATKLYELLSKKFEVLLDDRVKSNGEKFADADLIGIPYQLVIGDRSLKDGQVELKLRKMGEVTKVDLAKVESLIFS